MNLKKVAAAAAIVTSLGVGAIGFGAGATQADPGWGPNIPWIPGPGDWVPDVNVWPGPGDIAQWCPWHSPPGHWVGGPHGIPCT